MPEHYWRIHARIARRMLLDMPARVKFIVANDSEHTSEEYKWFERKVNDDARRLFEDGEYYDNQEWTFGFVREDRPWVRS